MGASPPVAPRSWEKSWKEWFAKPERQSAKKELDDAQRLIQLPISNDAAAELCNILNAPPGTGELELRDKLQKLEIEQLRSHVSGELSELKWQVDDWEAKRKTGSRRFGTGVQEFMESMDSFLSGFAGVVEVVRLADAQYGGGASAILALFFATAKLKASNDQAIRDSMQMIANRLPSLDIYYQTYPDDRLGNLLCKSYSDVIKFAQSATVYFQGRGLSRLVKSVTQPRRFEEIQSNMVYNFKEIRTYCDALLAKRILQLTDQNEVLIGEVKTLTGKVTTLKEEVQELHARADAKAAHTARETLHRHNSDTQESREEKLTSYLQLLKMTFAEYASDLKLLGVHDLQQFPEFAAWRHSRSSILVLHGYNHPDNHPSLVQSWLSVAALELVQHVRSSDADNAIVTHHSCEPERTAGDVMQNIIDQLLEQLPESVRRATDMQNVLHGINGHQDPLEGCCYCVSTIVSNCERHVYVVLDRPDFCQGGPAETWKLIRKLIKLVGKNEERLKILLVLRTDRWNIEERLLYLDPSERKRLSVLKLDQEEEL